MEKEKCFCPHCHAEITDFMHDAIVRYNRRKQLEAAKKKGITKEQRKAMNRASADRLRKWLHEHPEEVRKKAAAASHSRTADSFARQGQTIRETLHRKSLKFAELLYEARIAGKEITPELETSLMEKARKIIREENRAERIARRKAAAKK